MQLYMYVCIAGAAITRYDGDDATVLSVRAYISVVFQRLWMPRSLFLTRHHPSLCRGQGLG